MSRRRTAELGWLVVLCVVTYARALTIPLFEDDYPNIIDAQRYGTTAGLSQLIQDGWSFPRTSVYLLTNALWHLFGLRPAAFHFASLAVHVANTLLLFWLCRSWTPLRNAAFWTAAFFAVHEGHQEAVMWFSAIPELLMFLFGAGSLGCWKCSLERRHKGAWVAGSFILFCGALLSKESAVVFLPLFFLITPVGEWRPALRWLLPHGAAALAMVLFIVSLHDRSFRFSDGSFSLHAPVWITWPNSFARLLWIWGWPAAALVLWRAGRTARGSMLRALIWIGIAMAPYSFLTYMNRIPSRQIYLASAGLAMLVGLAMTHVVTMWENRRWAAAALVALMAAHNIGYIWTRKHQQFLERAAPTEELISVARHTQGRIWVQCFPRPRIVAEEALRLTLGRSPATLMWNEASQPPAQPVTPFCHAGR